MSNSNEVDASPTNQHASQQPPINLHDALLTLKELSISVMAADANQADETTSVNDRLQLPTTTNKTQTTAPFQPPPSFPDQMSNTSSSVGSGRSLASLGGALRRARRSRRLDSSFSSAPDLPNQNS